VAVGRGVGAVVGRGVGAVVGRGVGTAVGAGAGACVGRGVGACVGRGVGATVATGVGSGSRSGGDLVNHCVNDVLVQGARPLFFLDYVAFGKLLPEVVEQVVAGVASGCRENGCALIGGETAEMPGLYQPPDYDLAGFIVGMVQSGALLGAERVQDGDALVALGSSGLHTNGYSLARKVVFERMALGIHDPFPGEDASVAGVLLRIHRSYLAVMEPLLNRVHAMAHITGGGIPGNLNRAMPDHLSAIVRKNSWQIPNLFRQLQHGGDLDSLEMYNAFNMGVGLVVVCDDSDVDPVIASAREGGIEAWRVGRVAAGDGTVVLE
jgi:phosphoribosylformylglycinamidine cyclo-ligase